MMFPGRPPAEAFAAARSLGFEAVEYLFPYGVPVAGIKEGLDDTGIRMILLNTPFGDAAKGERGLAAVPGRQTDFRAHFDQALAYALPLGVPMIHVMAGIVPESQRDEAETVFVENVRQAADIAATHGILLLLEPLNHQDTPGYFLTRTGETRRLIEAIDRGNVRLQYDIYHRQIMEGDPGVWAAGTAQPFPGAESRGGGGWGQTPSPRGVLAALGRGIADNLDLIGHIQFSSVPGRHEPQYGEVDLPHLFEVCDRLGYDGWIGCEYRPMTTVEAGLTWGRPYGLGPDR